jgi:hypothetical protein
MRNSLGTCHQRIRAGFHPRPIRYFVTFSVASSNPVRKDSIFKFFINDVGEIFDGMCSNKRDAINEESWGPPDT